MNLLPAWLAAIATSAPNIPTRGYKLLDTFPHDPGAFTQGLHFEPERGTLLESTGLYGDSTARRVEIKTGRVLQQERLPAAWFGEGLAVVSNGRRIVQLLWRENLCLVRDAESLALERTVPMPNSMCQGWGLTHDGVGNLYASDGSSTLHVLCSDTLQVRRTMRVTAGGRPISNLNDLEWARGELWANLWREDRICAIDPRTGKVRCYVDLTGLLSPSERRRLGAEEVLNGLAFDEARGCFYVTGKCWPKMFRLEVVEMQD
jgi:glutamine cyclotransferase